MLKTLATLCGLSPGHNSGYSLKLFWKSEHLKHHPNNAAHSVSATSHRKKRSKQRMEASLAKKRVVVPATTSNQTLASETVSGAKVGSRTGTPNSYADALSVPGIGTSTSGLDADTQVPSNTCGPLASPQSAGGDESSVVLSPVASHTRSEVSSQCKEPQIDFNQRISASPESQQTYNVSASSVSTDSNPHLHLVLKLPDSLTGVIKHHEDFVRKPM